MNDNSDLAVVIKEFMDLKARIEELEKQQKESEKETCLQCGRKIDEEDIFWCEESEKAFCCEGHAEFYYRKNRKERN